MAAASKKREALLRASGKQSFTAMRQGKLRKQNRFMRTTKSVFNTGKDILQLTRPVDTPRVLLKKEPALSLLEPVEPAHKTDSLLPPEIRSILYESTAANIERYLKPHLKTITLAAGEELMAGEKKQCCDIYVVQAGQLEVFDFATGITLSVLGPGESLTSLLGLVNYLTDGEATDRVVGGRALVDDTVIVRIPSSAIKNAVDDHPQALMRMIRVVSRRLQRITFLVMYRYLGLAAELVQQPSEVDTMAVSASELTDGDDARLIDQISVTVASVLGVPKHARRIGMDAQLQRVSAGKVIVSQGDPSSDMYFVVRGKVVLTVSDPGTDAARQLYEVRLESVCYSLPMH